MSIVMKIIHKFTHKKFDKTNMKFSSTLNPTNAGIASKIAKCNSAFCEFQNPAFCEKWKPENWQNRRDYLGLCVFSSVSPCAAIACAIRRYPLCGALPRNAPPATSCFPFSGGLSSRPLRQAQAKHERPEPHRSTKCARGERQTRTFLAHFGGRGGDVVPPRKKIEKRI